MKNACASLLISTAYGAFTASYSENGLTRLRFPKGKPASRKELPGKLSPKIREWHRATESALKDFFTGQKAKLPPLDLEGTEFQKSVWAALRRVPSGQTRSYGEIAQSIGRPKAVRAVGGACGANPLPLLVPCHRILTANKKLGGFSGGLEWKRKLLAHEGIVL